MRSAQRCPLFRLIGEADRSAHCLLLAGLGHILYQWRLDSTCLGERRHAIQLDKQNLRRGLISDLPTARLSVVLPSGLAIYENEEG